MLSCFKWLRNGLDGLSVRLLGVLLCSVWIGLTAEISAQETPVVWGHGVKSCRDYLPVYAGWEEGREEDIGDYLRYRDWLAGLVTGLSLATGMDVLNGVEIEGAMRRVQIYCEDHPGGDFFTAGMDLIRQLSTLQ